MCGLQIFSPRLYLVFLLSSQGLSQGKGFNFWGGKVYQFFPLWIILSVSSLETLHLAPGPYGFLLFFLKGLYFTSHIQVYDPLWVVSSVQFSHLVVSDSLRPHGLQHARPPCPSPAPRVYPDPCPLSQWCHLTISSSVVPFSSCPQSFPASASTLLIRWPEYWSFSFSISPSNSELWVDFYVTPRAWISCVRLRLKFISVLVNIQHSSTNLLKKPSFLHGMALTLLSKISLSYLCGHSLNIRFAFLLF